MPGLDKLNFIKVLGIGSLGKVMLVELKGKWDMRETKSDSSAES